MGAGFSDAHRHGNNGRSCITSDEIERRDKLVTDNTKFVYEIANRYRNSILPFEDIVGEGNIGLIEAADRYDPAVGVKFVTYADWWIRKYVLEAIEKEREATRTNWWQRRWLKAIYEAGRRLSLKNGRAVSREETAVYMGIKQSKMDRYLMWRAEKVSLEEHPALLEGMADSNAVSPEKEAIEREARSRLPEWIAGLNEQQRKVIRLRHLTYNPMTLSEAGSEMGLSRERIRRIETRALRRLKARIQPRED